MQFCLPVRGKKNVYYLECTLGVRHGVARTVYPDDDLESSVIVYSI